MTLQSFHYKTNRFQQVKGFLAVVKYGTVTKAAEVLNLTHTSVFKQIKSLEDDLGIKLFQKVGRKLELTNEGKHFHELAIPSFQSMDSLFERFVSEKSEKDKKTIRIAANHVSISYILPTYIRSFKDLYNDVRFYISNTTRDDAERGLLKNEIDLFIYPSTEVKPEFIFYPIVAYTPILLVTKDHPLAKKTSKITLNDVKDYELVQIDKKLLTLQNFQEIVKMHKIKSTIILENADWEILKQFVRAKIGVAIISDICLKEYDSDLVAIPMTDYFPVMRYGALVKNGRSFDRYTTEFLHFIQKD